MDVIKVPDPRLRIKTKLIKQITPGHLKITGEMIKLTKTFTDPEGVGLASTQIGNFEQYFVMKTKNGTFREVFNPQIISLGKRVKKFFEGCLSIPDLYGEVIRPTAVRVSFIDKDGRQVVMSLREVEAWIFQHEYDHLQGKLFVDRCLEQKGRFFKVTGKDKAGAEIFEEVSL